MARSEGPLSDSLSIIGLKQSLVLLTILTSCLTLTFGKARLVAMYFGIIRRTRQSSICASILTFVRVHTGSVMLVSLRSPTLESCFEFGSPLSQKGTQASLCGLRAACKLCTSLA